MNLGENNENRASELLSFSVDDLVLACNEMSSGFIKDTRAEVHDLITYCAGIFNVDTSRSKFLPDVIRSLRNSISHNRDMYYALLELENDVLRGCEKLDYPDDIEELLAHSNDLIWKVRIEDGADFRFTYVNGAIATLTGLTKEELIEKGPLDIMPEDSVMEVMQLIASSIDEYNKTGNLVTRVATMNFTKYLEDGSTESVPREISATLLSLDEGYIEVLGISRDITERVEIQKRLEVSEERYRTLFENMTEGVAIHEIIYNESGEAVDYRIVSANPSYENHTDISPNDAVGKLATEVYGDVLFLSIYAKVAETGDPKEFEVDYMGRYFRISVSSPKKGQFATIFEDVTELKQQEKERERLEVQLVQAQKMEVVGRLAGGVAHDYNNILTAILGNAQEAMHVLGRSHPVHSELEVIYEASERAADLTGQLLAFSKQQVLRPKVLSIKEQMYKFERMSRRLITEDIEVNFDMGDDLHDVKIDPVQLDRIMMNLFVNARDAMPSGGNLTVHISNTSLGDGDLETFENVNTGEYLKISVEDTGSGMSEEVVSNIFEPFFTTKGHGTGLGLATVYGIVLQSNGDIVAESEVGKGSTFNMVFPKYQGEEASMDCDSEEGSGVDVLKGEGNIVLVEDEEAVRISTSRLLARSGFKVAEFGYAPDALEFFSSENGVGKPFSSSDVDLLLTDVKMPGINGPDLAAKIREIRPNIKVLYISGYGADVHGVDDSPFVQKPYTREILAQKVKSILEKEG